MIEVVMVPSSLSKYRERRELDSETEKKSMLQERDATVSVGHLVDRATKETVHTRHKSTQSKPRGRAATASM